MVTVSNKQQSLCADLIYGFYKLEYITTLTNLGGCSPCKLMANHPARQSVKAVEFSSRNNKSNMEASLMFTRVSTYYLIRLNGITKKDWVVAFGITEKSNSL